MKLKDLKNNVIFYLTRKQMSRTPKVVEITDEDEEVPVETTVIELTPTQVSLKKLTKQKTKYNRQLMSSQSAEERQKYQQLIDNINDIRFIIKMSNTNKNMVNKVLAYIEYPQTMQEIQESLIEKIEEDKI